MPDAVDMTLGKPLLVFNSQNGAPWHDKAKPIDGEFDLERLEQEMPELFFEVKGEPIYIDSPNGPVQVQGWKATVRQDTFAPLGVVSTKFRESQPRELFEFGYAVGGDVVKGDVAGSLYGGRLQFLTLAYNEGEAKRLFDFDPSEWKRYLVASGGNDGRHAQRAKNTDVRVLCGNTYNSHLREGGAEIVIRHTKNMTEKVEDAKRVLGLAQKQEDAFIAKMTDLSKRDVDWEGVKAYLNALFPVPKDDKPHTRIENSQAAVRDLFIHSPNLDGIGRNAYRLYQATIEYADHGRNYTSGFGSNEEARTMAILEGSAADIKDKALALLSKA